MKSVSCSSLMRFELYQKSDLFERLEASEFLISDMLKLEQRQTPSGILAQICKA